MKGERVMGGLQPRVKQNTTSESSEVECPKCQKKFIASMPKMEIMNTKTVSAAIWPHPDPIMCPHCNQAYVMTVSGLQVQVMYVQVDDGQQTRLIRPPAGFNSKVMKGGVIDG